MLSNARTLKHARDRRSLMQALERRVLLSGQLDTTFNGTGEVTLDPGTTSDARDVAIQDDGKVVVVGRASSNGNDFAVARFNGDGSPDASFGSNKLGFVRTHVGGTSLSESASSVAIAGDGKIVVGGWTSEKTVNLETTLFAIARYLPNGSLDTSFDGNGTKAIDFTDEVDTPLDSQGFDVAIQRDGKILWAGYSDTDSNELGDFMVMRLNDNGSFDNSFDDDGKRGIDFGGDDRALAMAYNGYGSLTTNADFGTIVLAGFTDDVNVPVFNRSLAITKLNSAGHLLSGFGNQGKVVLSQQFVNFEADDVYIQPDNKIVVVGRAVGPSEPGASDFFLLRLNSDGTFDPSFGPNGTGFFTTDFSGGTDAATAIVPNAAGDGLLVAGTSGRKFAIAQYTNNGILDSRFGSGGEVTTDFGSSFGGASMVGLARKGRRFAVAGGEHFKTARYLDAGANIVGIASLDATASEDGPDPATLMVFRSDRAPTPLRIYFTIGGTAKRPGSGVTPVGTDYGLTNVGNLVGTVQFVDIPINQTYTTITLTPTQDTSIEGDETAIFTIRQDISYEIGTPGSQTIDILDHVPPSVGTVVATADSPVRVGDVTQVPVTWTVPSGSWRQLNTIDLLLRDEDDGTFSLIRWEEAPNTLSLYDPETRSFGPGKTVGSDGVLSNGLIDVVLNMSSVKAAGPTSPVVTVTFALRLSDPSAARHRFRIEVAASNDAGDKTPFLNVGVIKVKKPKLLEQLDDAPLSNVLD